MLRTGRVIILIKRPQAELDLINIPWWRIVYMKYGFQTKACYPKTGVLGWGHDLGGW